MAESELRRLLAQRIAELWAEISEEARTGIPHLVGEISGGEELSVELNVAFFDDYRLERFLDDGVLFFVFPADEGSPRALFVSLWRFLQGKGVPRLLLPGVRLEGPLGEALRKLGFDVLWMTGDSIVEVWAVKGKVRYEMVFERTGEREFTLVEKRRVQ
ncbi:hypothetical protein [Thermococcus henrietii]|uniref:hypothetical protein n=1 Tax=Thermococcus henrietii TaxID=2016361 RepID=UPI000C080482|nr:hypothetical protein [Thermococcus henrietii]